jgi:hypothetical protein
VQQIRKNDVRRQLIVVTHDPNVDSMRREV